MDRPPGKLAVTDLAPAGAAETTRLADRERREVVVQHEGFLIGTFKRVDILLIFAGAECRDGESLGFAAGEEGGAMSARQDRHFRLDRPDRHEIAPVDPEAGIEDIAADDVLREM